MDRISVIVSGYDSSHPLDTAVVDFEIIFIDEFLIRIIMREMLSIAIQEVCS